MILDWQIATDLRAFGLARLQQIDRQVDMLIADLLMVFGPVVGYIPQYKLIKESKSLGNFSIDVCAILLLSNILRLFYWYAARFSVALLLQALLMIVAQILLLRLCVRVKNHEDNRVKQQSSENFLGSFWRWHSFENYLLFLAIYTFSIGLLTLLFVDVFRSTSYGQVIGFISLATEATLGFPQMIQNCKEKNVEGISVFLILTWFVGDFCKTIYFVANSQPAQFILCGAIQLTVDLIILIQLVMYRKKDDSEEIGSIEVVDSPPRQFHTLQGI